MFIYLGRENTRYPKNDSGGQIIATVPLLENSHSSLSGITLLIIGMVSMAIGSVYFQKVILQMPSLVINAWQVLFGTLILIVPSMVLEMGKPIDFIK